MTTGELVASTFESGLTADGGDVTAGTETSTVGGGDPTPCGELLESPSEGGAGCTTATVTGTGAGGGVVDCDCSGLD